MINQKKKKDSVLDTLLKEFTEKKQQTKLNFCISLVWKGQCLNRAISIYYLQYIYYIYTLHTQKNILHPFRLFNFEPHNHPSTFPP